MFVFGRDGKQSQQKLAIAKVLVLGAGGVGVEVAKNLILAGVHHVTIQDTNLVTMLDLGGNWCLSENSIGQNRASASLAPLQDLNRSVEVVAHTAPITTAFFEGFNAIVCTEALSESRLIEYNAYCRNRKLGFIATQSDGVFAIIFVDHGPGYQAENPKGIQPEPFIITNITNDDPAVVTLAEPASSLLGDDSLIRLLEVPGMPMLTNRVFPIDELRTQKEFTLAIYGSRQPKFDTTGNCGRGIQYFEPMQLEFLSYLESLQKIREDNVLLFDQLHSERDQQIIIAYAAIRKVLDRTDNISAVPLEDIIQIAQEINEMNPDNPLLEEGIDETILKELIREFGIVISPAASAIGGIAGQEVIKFITRQHTPISQFLALNWVSALPDDTSFTVHNDRYESFRRIFGDAQQARMQELSYFIVGAGAIGCESLKNYVMMGIGTSEGSRLVITDPDSIEHSNLSRQFMYRNCDVGSNKAQTAASAALRMNPTVHIEALPLKLDNESKESVFTSEFFSSLSGVYNALDNVAARQLTDELCRQFEKPLIDSGTEGAIASFLPIIPRVTGRYQAPDETNQKLPVCSLHKWPTSIAHTCLWARELFEEEFHLANEMILNLTRNPVSFTTFIEDGPDNAVRLLKFILLELRLKPRTGSDCIRWALVTFHNLFHRMIEDVLKECERNANAWTNGRHRPAPLTFDINDENHKQFIVATATIHGRIWGIDVGLPADILSDEILTSTTPDELESLIPTSKDITELVNLINEVRSSADGLDIHPELFEKDDDENGHMNFIASAASIRGVNYTLPAPPYLEAKRIAGRIIPAMATTTAMICGFACFELYKIHCVNPKTSHDYWSGMINLAFMRFAVGQAPPSPKSRLGVTSDEFDVEWDRKYVPENAVMQEFVEDIEKSHGVKVSALNSQGRVLWSDSDSDDEERRGRTFAEAFSGRQIRVGGASRPLEFVVNAYTDSGDDAFFPFFQVLPAA
jgi:ubiquitin-activating enzyme E1